MTRELKPYDELSRTGKKYRDDPAYRELMKGYSSTKVEMQRREKLKVKRDYTDDREIVGGWKPRVVDGVEVHNNTAVGDMVNATKAFFFVVFLLNVSVIFIFISFLSLIYPIIQTQTSKHSKYS